MILSEYYYKDFKFVGISEGGIHTCIAIPRFKIMFDTGTGTSQLVEIPRILLTHGHLDHASGIPYLVSQRSLRKLPKSEIYVPEAIYEPLDKILKLWREIEQYEFQYDLIPLKLNHYYYLQGNFYFQPIPSYHRIPSNGFVIIEKKQKLKEIYKHLPGYEIARLKNEKPDIIETVYEPIISFSGDTQIEFVLNNPIVQKSKILFMETTYICEKRPVERARKWGHTHLNEIVEYAEYFRDIEKIFLIHFSLRYTQKEIYEVLKRKLPGWLYEKTTAFLVKNKKYLESITY